MSRFSFLKVLAVGIFLILFSGLVNAQIFAVAYYRRLAQGNRLKEIILPAPRGIIFDKKGVTLVANTPIFEFDNQEISKDQAISLEAVGQKVAVISKREYLFGSLLAHVLGYVNSDGVGQNGLESFYENLLKGKNGKELVETDAMGEKLRVLSAVPAVAGKNLNLALDLDLQKAASLAMENLPAGRQVKGAVVVSNPKTGEILALYSSPSFDPNNVASYLESPDQPLFNRAISGAYPPGSTFKLITAAAGLETGAITKNTLIEDTGVITIGEYKFPNWKWLRGGGVDGWINVVTALAKSNDLFFYRVGEKTGIDNLILWAKKMGLGSVLGIDLPGEASGNVTKKEDWYLGNTYHWAIGKGDLLVTPLQVNSWTNTIASGGLLCLPKVTKSPSLPACKAGNPVTQCKNLGIKSETIATIKQGMVEACSPGGTAYPLFNFQVSTSNIQLACKTGTAEFGSEGKTHAWLTAFTDDISVTVLVEGGGEGSDVAAPIAKKVLEKWFGK